MPEDQTPISVGDNVHWTHVGGSKRTVSMTRREGKVEAIEGDDAVVRTSRTRTTRIALARLRPDGQRGQIDVFVDAVRQAHRDQTEFQTRADFDYSQPFDADKPEHRAELDRICGQSAPIPEDRDDVARFYLQGLAAATADEWEQE